LKIQVKLEVSSAVGEAGVRADDDVLREGDSPSSARLLTVMNEA